MSKCDLRVVFDRTDRTYRGGEEVSGEVHVRVNQDVTCNGLAIEHFWQTHGRGNRASGGKQSSVVFQGEWRAGESFRYPFRFTAPAGPPTYQGTYLNVDHYVNVRVDIPWAFDPKLKEEYILLPGPQAYHQGSRLPTVQQAKSSFEKFGVPIGIAMVVFGFIFFCPIGPVLIPGGLIVLFFALRRTLAEGKIGKVHLLWSSTFAQPGGQVPVRVTFTPRQSSDLNGITAEIVGKEVCVSGSGTNRKTHTHKLYERTLTLASRGKVVAGRRISLDGYVSIPQTQAYSFSAKDNKIVWEIEIRIDIPNWPDWLRTQTITVRPAESAEGQATEVAEPPVLAEQVADASPETFPAVTPDPIVAVPAGEIDEPWDADVEAENAPQRPEADVSEEPPEAPVENQPVENPLVGIVERLEAANRYSREREQIVAEQEGCTFECPIEVGRTERTYGLVTEDRFRDGRTITGKIAGTDCKVSMRLSALRNDEVDAIEPDDTFVVHCVLSKWNSIYEQLDSQEA